MLAAHTSRSCCVLAMFALFTKPNANRTQLSEIGTKENVLDYTIHLDCADEKVYMEMHLQYWSVQNSTVE